MTLKTLPAVGLEAAASMLKWKLENLVVTDSYSVVAETVVREYLSVATEDAMPSVPRTEDIHNSVAPRRMPQGEVGTHDQREKLADLYSRVLSIKDKDERTRRKRTVEALVDLIETDKIVNADADHVDALIVIGETLLRLPGGPAPLSGHMDVSGYETLREVLHMAYDQSARGKGAKRHANAKPFHLQPIMELGKMSGLGGHVYQMMKKAQEAGNMAKRGETDAARSEFLGVIVYAAAAHLLTGIMQGEADGPLI